MALGLKSLLTTLFIAGVIYIIQAINSVVNKYSGHKAKAKDKALRYQGLGRRLKTNTKVSAKDSR